jgi:hypothetical protein
MLFLYGPPIRAIVLTAGLSSMVWVRSLPAADKAGHFKFADPARSVRGSIAIE